MSYYIDNSGLFNDLIANRKLYNELTRMSYLVGQPCYRAIDEVMRVKTLELYGFLDWLESASPEALEKFTDYPFTDD